MLSQIQRIQSVLLAVACCAGAGSLAAQDSPATSFRALPQWTPGEKATYQVQQVVKERTGGKEETRFLSNGQLEITAVAASADSLTFTWHRRMDNGELEMVREPWGIRGNAASEKLINNLIRDGLPVTLRLDLRTHRAWVENREELTQAIRRSLQSVGGDFSGNVTGVYRAQTPGEQSSREPSRAQLGIQGPLVRRDETKVGFTPRSAPAIAAWYGRLVQGEVEDFLGLLGRTYAPESESTTGGAKRSYRATGPGDVLLTLTSAPAVPEPQDAAPVDEDKDGRPAAVGLAGGAVAPLAFDAKVEVTTPSVWPKRAAIVRTEAASGDADAKRTTQRRVYLRQ